MNTMVSKYQYSFIRLRSSLSVAFFMIFGFYGRCALLEEDNSELSYLQAKYQAEMTDMNYVLYFYSDWSVPCQWMETTTFQDMQWKHTKDNNFIFVPLDIDEFEGYALKEYFEVDHLPTLLMFNSRHELIGRVNQSVNASTFMKLLEESEVESLSAANHVHEKEKINQPPSPRKTSIQSGANKSKLDPLPDELANELRRYTVQVGAFKSSEFARQFKSKIEQYTSRSVEINTSQDHGMFTYYVRVGQFIDKSDAKQLKHSIAQYGFDGFIRPSTISRKS